MDKKKLVGKAVERQLYRRVVHFAYVEIPFSACYDTLRRKSAARCARRINNGPSNERSGCFQIGSGRATILCNRQRKEETVSKERSMQDRLPDDSFDTPRRLIAVKLSYHSRMVF